MLPRGLAVLFALTLGCRFDLDGLGSRDLVGDVGAADVAENLDAAGEGAGDLVLSDAPRDGDSRHDSPRDDGAQDSAPPDSGVVDPAAPFGAPSAVTELNSADEEDDPTLTGDMLEIYFNRSGDIYAASRAKISDPWSPPQQVAQLSSADSETNPEITPDGLTIFFASNRSHAQAQGGHDIYVSTRSQRGQPWSAPAPVVSLNTADSDHPAPAPDLLTMVVISTRPPCLGGHDLYLSTRGSTSAPWGATAAITSLNTATQESSAWIDAATLLLYYASSQGSDHDIYLSARAAVGQPFGPPVNLASLNSPETDEDPWLSPDLRTVYFASTRNGQNDLFIATR